MRFPQKFFEISPNCFQYFVIQTSYRNMQILLNFYLLLSGRMEVLISIRMIKVHHETTVWQSYLSELWVSQHWNLSSTYLKWDIQQLTHMALTSHFFPILVKRLKIFFFSISFVLFTYSWLTPLFECFLFCSCTCTCQHAYRCSG